MRADLGGMQVLRRMVRDLSFSIRIVGVPTLREADGLAMSRCAARWRLGLAAAGGRCEWGCASTAALQLTACLALWADPLCAAQPQCAPQSRGAAAGTRHPISPAGERRPTVLRFSDFRASAASTMAASLP